MMDASLRAADTESLDQTVAFPDQDVRTSFDSIFDSYHHPTEPTTSSSRSSRREQGTPSQAITKERSPRLPLVLPRDSAAGELAISTPTRIPQPTRRPQYRASTRRTYSSVSSPQVYSRQEERATLTAAGVGQSEGDSTPRPTRGSQSLSQTAETTIEQGSSGTQQRSNNEEQTPLQSTMSLSDQARESQAVETQNGNTVAPRAALGTTGSLHHRNRGSYDEDSQYWLQNATPNPRAAQITIPHSALSRAPYQQQRVLQDLYHYTTQRASGVRAQNSSHTEHNGSPNEMAAHAHSSRRSNNRTHGTARQTGLLSLGGFGHRSHPDTQSPMAARDRTSSTSHHPQSVRTPLQPGREQSSTRANSGLPSMDASQRRENIRPMTNYHHRPDTFGSPSHRASLSQSTQSSSSNQPNPHRYVRQGQDTPQNFASSSSRIVRRSASRARHSSAPQPTRERTYQTVNTPRTVPANNIQRNGRDPFPRLDAENVIRVWEDRPVPAVRNQVAPTLGSPRPPRPRGGLSRAPLREISNFQPSSRPTRCGTLAYPIGNDLPERQIQRENEENRDPENDLFQQPSQRAVNDANTPLIGGGVTAQEVFRLPIREPENEVDVRAPTPAVNDGVMHMPVVHNIPRHILWRAREATVEFVSDSERDSPPAEGSTQVSPTENGIIEEEVSTSPNVQSQTQAGTGHEHADARFDNTLEAEEDGLTQYGSLIAPPGGSGESEHQGEPSGGHGGAGNRDQISALDYPLTVAIAQPLSYPRFSLPDPESRQRRQDDGIPRVDSATIGELEINYLISVQSHEATSYEIAAVEKTSSASVQMPSKLPENIIDEQGCSSQQQIQEEIDGDRADQNGSSVADVEESRANAGVARQDVDDEESRINASAARQDTGYLMTRCLFGTGSTLDLQLKDPSKEIASAEAPKKAKKFKVNLKNARARQSSNLRESLRSIFRKKPRRHAVEGLFPSQEVTKGSLFEDSESDRAAKFSIGGRAKSDEIKRSKHTYFDGGASETRRQRHSFGGEDTRWEEFESRADAVVGTRRRLWQLCKGTLRSIRKKFARK